MLNLLQEHFCSESKRDCHRAKRVKRAQSNEIGKMVLYDTDPKPILSMSNF